MTALLIPLKLISILIILLNLDNGVVTPYYTDKISYRFNYNPWNPMTGANGETSAEFYDGLISPLYGLDVVPYEVKIETNPVNDKIIRVVDPTESMIPFSTKKASMGNFAQKAEILLFSTISCEIKIDSLGKMY